MHGFEAVSKRARPQGNTEAVAKSATKSLSTAFGELSLYIIIGSTANSL